MIKLSGRVVDSDVYEKTRDRASVFLDMNVWIDLADEKTEQAKQIKSMLQSAVNKGKVFCPVVWAVVHELFKQENDSSTRVGELIEELSLNLSFGIFDEIFTDEINSFIFNVLGSGQRVLPIQEMYVPAPFCCSSHMNLSFPDMWSDSEARDFLELTLKEASKMRLTDYIQDRYSKDLVNYSQMMVTAQQAADWYSAWHNANGNRNRMWRQELHFAIFNFLLPRLLFLKSKLTIPDQIYFTQYLLALPRDKFGSNGAAVLEYLPAMRNYVELFTAAALNPSMKITANHIYDINMLIVPLAYADVVVSRDGWIKRLLLNDTSLLRDNNTQFCSSLQQLHSYLGNAS